MSYGKTKVHFADENGLHMCVAKRSFKFPLELTQDSSAVTCAHCKAGRMSGEWLAKSGKDRKRYVRRPAKSNSKMGASDE